MLTLNKKHIPLIVITAFIFLFLSIITGTNTGIKKNNVFRILVSDKNEAYELSKGLSTEFNIISRYTSTITVNLFGVEKSILINDIDTELNEIDPRRTAYVNNIDSLFYSESGEYEIIYLFSDMSPVVFSLFYSGKIDKICSDWFCPETGFGDVMFQSVSIALFIIVFIVLFRKFKISVFLFLPWLSLFFAWRYDLICISFCIIYLASFLSDLFLRVFLDEKRIFLKGLLKKTPSSPVLIIFILALNILFIIFSGNIFSVFTVIFSLLYNSLVISAFFIFSVNSVKEKDNNIFKFKSIVGNEKLFLFSRKKIKDAVLIVMLCLLFVLIPSVKNSSTQNIPYLRTLNNSWQSVSMMDEGKKENPDIVQISDYIKHVIFQRYYQYGITEFLPEIGQEIAFTHYKKQNGSIEKQKEILFIFTDSYYSDILQAIPKNSAANIFKKGAELTGIFYISASGSLFKFFDWWQYLITVLFIVIPIIFYYFTIKPVYLSRVFIVFTRRNRQSA